MVYQYHYTNWPDHGIPENPLPILSFVRKSAAANPEGAGPIVVHCRSVVVKFSGWLWVSSWCILSDYGRLHVLENVSISFFSVDVF